jgi:hypothetical protein
MSIYLAIAVASGTSLVILVGVWIGTYLSARKWPYVSFSPLKFKQVQKSDELVLTDEQHDFQPLLGHYLKTAEAVIALASASIVFIPHLSPTLHSAQLAMSMTWLGICVVALVLFMASLLYRYERSLYFPSTYRPWM